MAENFDEAATRAFEDACSLHDAAGPTPAPARLGIPDHLFGLAAECALKAILHGLGQLTLVPGKRPLPKRLAVHVDALWSEYVSQVSGRGAYIVQATNPFTDWAVGHRYEEHALFSVARLQAHRDGALEAMLVLEVARVDGVVT